MLYALADKADSLGIPVHENRYVSRLLVHDGRCFGAFAFDIHSGERTVYLADAVVLATGGHTRLWRRSSSRRDENTGDGMYLALEAGCRLADMELVQFHPTGMVYPEEWAGTLVTEAVRGEGGRLYNADGERYMQRYDPERLELSARDRVALANYTEISEGRGTEHGGVHLDISHREKSYILEKLPRMYRQFLEAQMLDISSEPMEVAPTSHYSMGGVVVEPETHATDVEGLYAAGETTTGLHGANRLGGNSLSETDDLRSPRRRGGRHVLHVLRRTTALQAEDSRGASDELSSFIREGDEFARPLQRALRNTMWECCGVVRNEEKLREGLNRLEGDSRPRQATWTSGPPQKATATWPTPSTCVPRSSRREASLLGAVERRESRGAHSRSDHPELDPGLKTNFVVTRDGAGNLSVSGKPVEAVPDHLKAWAKDDGEVDVAGRLLE